jgi:excisionase family DNA binding protein
VSTDQTLLTTAEAARKLGISTSWLKRQVAAGAVTHTRFGRAVRFSEEQVAAIVEQRTQPASDSNPRSIVDGSATPTRRRRRQPAATS